MKICQYPRLHMKIICWRFHIKTPFYDNSKKMKILFMWYLFLRRAFWNFFYLLSAFCFYVCKSRQIENSNDQKLASIVKHFNSLKPPRKWFFSSRPRDLLHQPRLLYSFFFIFCIYFQKSLCHTSILFIFPAYELICVLLVYQNKDIWLDVLFIHVSQI